MKKLSTNNKLGNLILPHRNSRENMDVHHLYEIVDKETDDTFKYGISADSIDKDGLSNRVRGQVNKLNRLYEWERFFGRVLVKNIQGNNAAREIETQFIKDYELKNRRKPKDNLKYSCKN
jgi:URI fold toxin 2